jgi:hypothetical protein
MWTLAGAIYAACKWLTWRRTPAQKAPRWRHTAYLLAYPGLDATGFLTRPARALAGPQEWLHAAARFTFGAVLFLAAGSIAGDRTLAAGWIGMTGLVFMLHFGLFHLASCAWRAAGVEALPLMNRPLVSTSLTEFWSRRWNAAFRDFAHRFLFRPMQYRIGPRAAIAAGFVFSGVVHDVVISVPAGAGFGGPTLFFVIQAAGLLFERTAAGRRAGLGRGLSGWAFTALTVLAPLPLLFHTAFVTNVIVPFMRAAGVL